MIVLSGDVGGTNTRLALVDCSAGIPGLLAEQVYQSNRYSTFYEVLGDFVSTHKNSIDAVCLGIAGPVRNGRCPVTNLSWVIEAGRVGDVSGVDQVYMLNDLEAIGWGIQALGAQDFHVLNEGKVSQGNAAVIAAGTGLGEAGLYRDGPDYRPFACEGGHADFSPSNPLETSLYDWLAAQYGHVSWERVVSGAGLIHLYDFLLQHHEVQSPDWLVDEALTEDMAVVISGAAMAGKDPVCVEALDLFVRFYAAEAGNLALKMMASGGIYLAGGIAPGILDRLKQKDFMQVFCAKGRMSGILQDIPVRVVLNERVGLIGAAVFARRTGSANRGCL